jgi:predicted small secreted protein
MRVWSVLLILLFLAGCNTLQGLGKDLRRGGEILENAAK